MGKGGSPGRKSKMHRGRASHPSSPKAKPLKPGTYTLTLKTSAKSNPSDLWPLYVEAYKFKQAVNEVIDELWKMDELPSVKQLHKMVYYRLIEEYGLSGSLAQRAYRLALEIVKSARKNNAKKKPRMRHATVRLSKYDFKLDADKKELVIALGNKKLGNRRRVVLRLTADDERFKQFTQYKLAFEIILKFNSRLDLAVILYFKKEYRPYQPTSKVAVDVNFDLFALYGGKQVKYWKTAMPEALKRRMIAFRLQEKYPRACRTNKKILENYRGNMRRSRTLVEDDAVKYAKRIVEEAKKMNAIIVLEDLNGLKNKIPEMNGSKLRLKVASLAYRKYQHRIITEAIKEDVPVVIVSARGTSSVCPRCGTKLEDLGGRVLKCKKCGLIRNRDWIASLNTYLRFRMGPHPGSGDEG
jgi:IS605 OrfB family transposase